MFQNKMYLLKSLSYVERIVSATKFQQHLFLFRDCRGPANIPIETGPTADRMKFTNT